MNGIKKGGSKTRPYFVNFVSFVVNLFFANFAFFAVKDSGVLRALALLQLFDQLRHNFEEVANHTEVGINYGFSATTLPFFQT